LKDLLEKYFKLSIIFLRNLFEKNLNQNIIFLLLFKPMQACLQKFVLQNCFIQYGLLSQTIIECVFQSLFYKLLFYYFRKDRVQTLLFYASKPILLSL
jgi:hypothetical protein